MIDLSNEQTLQANGGYENTPFPFYAAGFLGTFTAYNAAAFYLLWVGHPFIAIGMVGAEIWAGKTYINSINPPSVSGEYNYYPPFEK